MQDDPGWCGADLGGAVHEPNLNIIINLNITQPHHATPNLHCTTPNLHQPERDLVESAILCSLEVNKILEFKYGIWCDKDFQQHMLDLILFLF